MASVTSGLQVLGSVWCFCAVLAMLPLVATRAHGERCVAVCTRRSAPFWPVSSSAAGRTRDLRKPLALKYVLSAEADATLGTS